MCHCNDGVGLMFLYGCRSKANFIPIVEEASLVSHCRNVESQLQLDEITTLTKLLHIQDFLWVGRTTMGWH